MPYIVVVDIPQQLRKEECILPTMDYSKLQGRIKEKGFTQKSLSAAVGISESHLCQKLSGNYPFKQSDIQNICRELDINALQIGEYFFTPKC